MQVSSPLVSKGIVQFMEFPAEARMEIISLLQHGNQAEADRELRQLANRTFFKQNLVFNYPREQYAKLDRGDTPGSINASWLTLSTSEYSDPSVQTVTGESLRVNQTTQVADPTNARASILRFILDVGQFVGTWNTAILIGGDTATSTPGTGKIIAAVNGILDDLGQTLTRTGSTIHLVNWTLKHLDSSEV